MKGSTQQQRTSEPRETDPRSAAGNLPLVSLDAQWRVVEVEESDFETISTVV